MLPKEITKAGLRNQVQELGAEFIGFAAVDRWGEFADVPVAGYPQTIWPWAKTVIVFGVPLWLPIIEAAPNVWGREQVIVTSKLLEKVAYRLRLFLNSKGYQTVSVSGYNNRDSAESEAVFSNVWAGYYAGLGTVGWNHALLTREYGPRVQLKSVFTELELVSDSVLTEEFCTNCLYCQKICPVQALRSERTSAYAVVDQTACQQHKKRLQTAFCDPCGSCLKVCPVGEDRQLFQSNNFNKYFVEQEILARNPQAEEYQDWVHIRNYGSYSLETPPKKTD